MMRRRGGVACERLADNSIEVDDVNTVATMVIDSYIGRQDSNRQVNREQPARSVRYNL